MRERKRVRGSGREGKVAVAAARVVREQQKADGCRRC